MTALIFDSRTSAARSPAFARGPLHVVTGGRAWQPTSKVVVSKTSNNFPVSGSQTSTCLPRPAMSSWPDVSSRFMGKLGAIVAHGRRGCEPSGVGIVEPVRSPTRNPQLLSELNLPTAESFNRSFVAFRRTAARRPVLCLTSKRSCGNLALGFERGVSRCFGTRCRTGDLSGVVDTAS